jgi:hypothetical protein
VFDDEPAQLLEAARAIQNELLSDQRIQIQIQAYRMDWLYHALQEIEEHRSQIAMIWLIDLHQKYALDERVRAQATGLIDDLGDEARKAVEELYRTAAEKLGKDQQIVPDGVALIAKARERKIPFFVSSKYLESEYILPLLRKLAIGDNNPAADYWEVRKVAGEIEEKSRDRLKARILELAQPLPREMTTLLDQNAKWYSHPITANTVAIIAVIVCAAGVYWGYKAVDLATSQPEYQMERLTFASPGEQQLEWDLLDRAQFSALPRAGQVANFELETRKSGDHLLAVWYLLGSPKPLVLGPKMASLDSIGNTGFTLEKGDYFVFFLLSNDKPLFTDELQKKLLSEVRPLLGEIRDATGVWVCDKGHVRSKSAGTEQIHLLDGPCQSIFQEFEATDPKNRKISMVAFSVK